MTPSASEPPYDFLKSFARACEAMNMGLNHANLFDWFFSFGYVFKAPDYMLLACEDPDDPDAWLVFWAETTDKGRKFDMIRHFLTLVPPGRQKPKIAWSRLLRGRASKRYFLTDRLLRLTRSGAPES